jgi:hypothetical protein
MEKVVDDIDGFNELVCQIIDNDGPLVEVPKLQSDIATCTDSEHTWIGPAITDTECKHTGQQHEAMDQVAMWHDVQHEQGAVPCVSEGGRSITVPKGSTKTTDLAMFVRLALYLFCTYTLVGLLPGRLVGFIGILAFIVLT